MMKTKGRVNKFSLFAVWQSIVTSAIVCEASIVLNEIAYKGSSNDECNGKDWIELLNSGSTEVNLMGYTLHDDKGKEDEDARVFSSDVSLAAGELKVLCQDVDFDFGIGSSDTVTLLDNNGTIVTAVTLPGNDVSDQSYAYFFDTDEFKYTTTITFDSVNIQTDPKPLEETLEEQNNTGNDFFLQFPDLTGTSDVFNKVVDIHINMNGPSHDEIKEFPMYERFVPFTQISVFNSDNNNQNAPLVVGGSGKIRTKGQSSLSLPACLGLAVPFHVEFDKQFLGLETVYFRNALAVGEEAYMKDYASHIMLAKFGLPYLRCRFIRLYINGEYNGFYTMMEAPTQGYVMQRSFGAFDPSLTAIFKMKSQMPSCPFPQSDIDMQANREVPDPYYFERGSHRDQPIPASESSIMSGQGLNMCYTNFLTMMGKEYADIVRGYIEYDNTCGLAMVNIGQVDRDYGPKAMEDPMISFLDNTFYNKSVIDIKDEIDDDQWIKSFAYMAVLLHVDSPINNINNWFLATTSGGANDWKIVQYDHNLILSNAADTLCNQDCGSRMLYWPILRPTCGAVEDHRLLGRILNDETNKEKYIEYVQEFANIITPAFIDDLKVIDNAIKEYSLEDPAIASGGQQVTSFLTVLESRLEQVNAQLDAIKTGTLPRDGIYGRDEVCPDWRSSNGDSFIPAGGDDAGCADAAFCYNEGCVDGKMVVEQCLVAAQFCDAFFPDSPCVNTDMNDKKIASINVTESNNNSLPCSMDEPCSVSKDEMSSDSSSSASIDSSSSVSVDESSSTSRLIFTLRNIAFLTVTVVYLL